MASALGIRPSNYARRKDQDDFPSFEELTRLGEHFDINPLVLQISFGFLPPDAIYLLDEAGLDSYRQLGGGDFPDLPLPWNGEEKSRTVPSAVRPQQLQQRL